MSEKEYIERGALIAFVREARKKLPKDSKDFFTRDEMLLNFQQYVELHPAADVAEVVRCKDCRYADGVYVLDSEPRYILCSKHRICVKPRGYCSYGERKIDGARAINFSSGADCRRKEKESEKYVNPGG